MEVTDLLSQQSVLGFAAGLLTSEATRRLFAAIIRLIASHQLAKALASASPDDDAPAKDLSKAANEVADAIEPKAKE